MKNILFDLDDTIGNTLPLCIAAFREALEPLIGRHLTDEDIIAAFGPSEEGTIAMLLPEYTDEALNRYIEAYERLHSGWPEAGSEAGNKHQGPIAHRLPCVRIDGTG